MTRYIQRHSLLTRVTHGVAAVACILLAVTGVFVFVFRRRTPPGSAARAVS